MGTSTFNYTGSAQPFTVPAGVTVVTLVLLGAQGGFAGGLGAEVLCDLAVTPAEVLGVYVGGSGDSGGWNGGGAAGAGGFPGYVGGGASDVRQGGSTLADRVATAGGGGGVIGGDGGAPNGGDGDTGGGFMRGRGATTSAGGAGGPPLGGGSAGTAGVLGVGGDGGAGGSGAGGSGGGGGGFGGGGGGGHGSDTAAGGGGGGSSVGTGVAETITGHVNFGDGEIVITWTDPPPVLTGWNAGLGVQPRTTGWTVTA